jgi:hypothetical protein
MVDNFRGVYAVELANMLDEAVIHGGLVLMKNVNVRENLGKVPSLVLAEQLIAMLHRPPEEMDDGAYRLPNPGGPDAPDAGQPEADHGAMREILRDRKRGRAQSASPGHLALRQLRHHGGEREAAQGSQEAETKEAGRQGQASQEPTNGPQKQPGMIASLQRASCRASLTSRQSRRWSIAP